MKRFTNWQKKQAALAMVAMGFFGTVQEAAAAVDAAVATGVATLEADAATLGGIATGAVVTIMLIVLGIRLVKKLLGRAV